MSVTIPRFERSAVVRDAQAEVLGAPHVKVKLLADSSATGGALSTVRVSLEKGADGARLTAMNDPQKCSTYSLAEWKSSPETRY